MRIAHFDHTIIIKNILNYYRETEQPTGLLPKDIEKGICNTLMTLKAIEFFEARHGTEVKQATEIKSVLSPMTQLFERMANEELDVKTIEKKDIEQIVPYIFPCQHPEKYREGIGFSQIQLLDIIKLSHHPRWEKMRDEFKCHYTVANVFSREMLETLIEALILPDQLNLLNTHNHMLQIEKIDEKYYIHDVNHGTTQYELEEMCSALWEIAMPEKAMRDIYKNVCIGLQIYDEKDKPHAFYDKREFINRQKATGLLEEMLGPDNITPLLFASKLGDTLTVEELLKNFTSPHTVNRRDTDGNTALRLACLYDIGQPIVRLLSAYTYTDLNLSNPLYAAVAKRQTDSVRYLLRAAVRRAIVLDVNQTLYKSKDNTTALMIACGKGYQEIIDLLLSYRDLEGKFACHVNIRDNRGYTALHFAAIFGQLEAVVKLLKRPDINPCLRSRYCGTPVEYALKHKHFKIADMIFNHQKYATRRHLGIFWFCIGVAVLIPVFTKTDSTTSRGLSALAFLPLLIGILFHQILKLRCRAHEEFSDAKQPLPRIGNNNHLGIEDFSPEEKIIISGMAVKEKETEEIFEEEDSKKEVKLHVIKSADQGIEEFKAREREDSQEEEGDSLKKEGSEEETSTVGKEGTTLLTFSG